METSKSKQVIQAFVEENSISEVLNEYSSTRGNGIGIKSDASMLAIDTTYQYDKNTDYKWHIPSIEIDGIKYDYAVVDSQGGYEGGGEEAHRVIAVFELIDEVDAKLIGFVQINGFYSSYSGTEWDSVDDWADVLPKEVMVVQYKPVI